MYFQRVKNNWFKNNAIKKTFEAEWKIKRNHFLSISYADKIAYYSNIE